MLLNLRHFTWLAAAFFAGALVAVTGIAVVVLDTHGLVVNFVLADAPLDLDINKTSSLKQSIVACGSASLGTTLARQRIIVDAELRFTAMHYLVAAFSYNVRESGALTLSSKQ